jgi:glycosyltransferase involved in cell wall biosynthesis
MRHAVSIVMIARNEEARIESCIRSVIDASRGLDAEVILVDSASEDRTVAIAEKFDIRILSVRRDACQSAALSRAIGALHCSGRYIQFIDADMTMDSAWVWEALSYLETAGPSIAAVAGEIRQNPTSNPYREYRRRNLARMTRTREPKDLKSLYGAFMIRAEVLREVGSFDPHLKANEEGELSDRILAAGYRIRLLPHLSCFHHVTGTEGFILTLRRELGNYVMAGQLLRCSFRNGSLAFRLWQFKYCFLAAGFVLFGIAALTGVLARFVPEPGSLWFIGLALIAFALFIREERRFANVFYYLVVYLSSWIFVGYGLLRPTEKPRPHRSPPGHRQPDAGLSVIAHKPHQDSFTAA